MDSTQLLWALLALSPETQQVRVLAFGGVLLSTRAHHMLSYVVNLGKGRNRRDV